MGQESGHNLPGCLCLKVSSKVATRTMISSSIWTRGGSPSELTYTVAGRFLSSFSEAVKQDIDFSLDVDWRPPQVPSYGPLLRAAHNMGADVIREIEIGRETEIVRGEKKEKERENKRESDQERGKSPSLYNLILQIKPVILDFFCLLKFGHPLSMGRNYTLSKEVAVTGSHFRDCLSHQAIIHLLSVTID